MQASQDINEQGQVQMRWVPSLLELEVRHHMLGIDRQVEMQRCEAYRRMMLAMAAGRYPGQLLPVPGPMPGPGPPMPQVVPVGGSSSFSSSFVTQPASIPVPPGAVATPAARESRSVLPSSLAPPSSSSRLSNEPSGRGPSSGRGDRGCRGRAGALTRHRPGPIDAGPPRNALNDDDEPRTVPASASASQRSVGRRQDQPRPGRPVGAISITTHPGMLRQVFRYSLANTFPTGPRFDLLSLDSHSSSLPASNNRFGSRHAVDVFLRENGIDPSTRLKPQDAALADATPDVMVRPFARLFGGIVFHERPSSRVRNILCVDPVVHPYAPSSPGQPGVLFIAPGTPLHEDEHPSFHLFINVSPQETHRVERQYRYAGDYIKVPIASSTVEVEDWLSLPIRCRAAWSWRMFTSTMRSVRATHARIDIRNKRPQGPPPSQNEIDKWLEKHPEKRTGMTERVMINAFNAGDEKMNFTLIKNIGYNIEVAKKLQGMDGSASA